MVTTKQQKKQIGNNKIKKLENESMKLSKLIEIC